MSKIWSQINTEKEVGFEVVVHSWLKDEAYSHNLDVTNVLISNPDFNNQSENNERFKLLNSFRGPMIDQLPKDIIWYEVKIYKKT